jgi:hypothetical protein
MATLKVGALVVASGGRTGTVVRDLGPYALVEFDTLTMPCEGRCGCEVPLRKVCSRERLSPAQQVLA